MLITRLFSSRHISTIFFVVLLLSIINVYAAQREAEKFNESGLKYLEKGQLRQAFMQFKKASDYDSLYADPLYYQGIIYEKRENPEEARKKFEAALSLTPQDLKIIKKINEFKYKDFIRALEEDNFSTAQRIIDALLNSAPSSARYLFGQGRLYIRKEEWPAAAKFLYQVIQKGNNYEIKEEDQDVLVMAHAYYSLVSFQNKKYYEAYIHIKRAQKTSKVKNSEIEKITRMVAGSDNPLVRLWREADELYEKHKYQEALEKYEKVLEYHRSIKEVQDKIETIEKIFKAVELNKKAEQLYRESKWVESKEIYLKMQDLGFSEEKIKLRIQELDKRIYKINHPEKKIDLSDSAFEKDLEIMQKHELFGEIDDNYYERYKRAQELYDSEEYSAAMGIFQSIYVDKPDYEDVSAKMKKCQAFINNKKKSSYANIVYAVIVVFIIFFIINLIKKNLPIWRKKKAMKALEKARAKKNWKKVISICKKLIAYAASEKEIGKINLNIAQAFLNEGQYSKTIEHAQLVLKCDHRSSAGHSVLAKAFLEIGNVSDSAIKEYQTLIKLEPRNNKLLNVLAGYYIKREAIDKDAIDIYKKLLKVEPENFKVLELIGVSYKESSRMDAEALRVYEEIIKKDATNMEFHQTLAHAYFEKELFEESINHSRIFLNTSPENKGINKIFQQSFIKLKKLTECILEYERIAENFSDSKFLKRTIDKLYEMRSLAGDTPQSNNTSGEITEKAQSSGRKSIIVCPKCACLNSPGAKVCKRCQAPIIS